jgi:hypothetical protein
VSPTPATCPYELFSSVQPSFITAMQSFFQLYTFIVMPGCTVF